MTFVLVFLAVLPSILLLIYIYKRDSVNKEPMNLLFELFFFGCLSAFPIITFEYLITGLMDTYINNFTLYNLFDAFVCAALVEEAFKFLFTIFTIWNNRAFDSTFDGMVYCAFVSMGFATVENVLYCIYFGISTAFIRMFVSVPGHFSYAIMMGYFLSKAKKAEINDLLNAGTHIRYRWFIACALIVPIIQHGLYDFCLMQGSDFLLALFDVVVIASYLIIFITVRRGNRKDSLFYENGNLL